MWWGFWHHGPVSQQDPSPGSGRAGPSGPTSAAVRPDHGLGCRTREHKPSVDRLWLQLRPHGFSGSLSQAASQGQRSGRFQGLLGPMCLGWAPGTGWLRVTSLAQYGHLASLRTFVPTRNTVAERGGHASLWRTLAQDRPPASQLPRLRVGGLGGGYWRNGRTTLCSLNRAHPQKAPPPAFLPPSVAWPSQGSHGPGAVDKGLEV